MVFIHLGKLWHLLAANIFDMWTAWVEGAALRQICQRRWAAGYTGAHTLIAELGQRIDQKLRIGMLRFGKNLLCGRLFNDLPGIHNADSVSDIGMYAHIMRN